jgi:mitogen-activated protein kinase 1/3
MSTTTSLSSSQEQKEAKQKQQAESGMKAPVLRSLTVNNNKFELPSKYTVTGLIGQGAYGIVVAGYDNETKQKVAIKKIFNVFEQDREYQKRILREVKILRHFRNHENIVSLKDLIPPRNFDEFKDVYIVTDLMDSDMRAIVRSPQELSDQNIQYFLYQILRGIKYIHSANVLHRDIKPSNILLNSEMDVKICDFGLSRGVDFENDPTMSTPYVATRWYRGMHDYVFNSCIV